MKLNNKWIKLVLIITFLYISFFSIQNFWQGYHDLDISFNFLHLGYTQDTNNNGLTMTLEETYMSGLNNMRMAFIWLSLNCILAVIIGYSYGGFNGKKK